jgi:hypothetical protein
MMSVDPVNRDIMVTSPSVSLPLQPPQCRKAGQLPSQPPSLTAEASLPN